MTPLALATQGFGYTVLLISVQGFGDVKSTKGFDKQVVATVVAQSLVVDTNTREVIHRKRAFQ